MSETTLAEVIDQGDPSSFFNAVKEAKLGSLLAGEGGVRLVRETVAVESDAALPSYAVARLLRANVTAVTTGTGEKHPCINGTSGLRTVRETGLAVASSAAPTTFPVEAVRACTTVTSSVRSRKDPVSNRATLAANQVKGTDSSAIATKAIALYSTGPEVADGSTADIVYDTFGGVAVPNSGGTSIAFFAGEITGAATVELEYLTAAPVSGATALTDEAEGIY